MGLKYLYVPSGVKAGTAYGVMPNSANADFDDFTRSSAGSRVDKNGFINTGLGLGSEEVVNGGFDTDSNWTKGTGWNINNGKANALSVGSGQSLLQGSNILSDKIYKVVYTVSNYIEGGVYVRVGNSGIGTTRQENGTFTEYIEQSGNTTLYFTAYSGSTTLSIDNVSVREVTDANTNVPRLDYTDGGCPSLLLEDTSTNITQYSEDFTQSSWTKEGNPTIESDVEISPTGSLNGSYLKAPVGTSITPRISTSFSCVSGQTYTGSIFVKKDNVDYIRIISTGATASTLDAYCNVSNGILGNSGSPDKAKIEDYGNGWYRLSLVINATQSTGSATFRIQLAKGDGVPASTYDGTEKNIIFGAQLEQQSYATSYIPNYGASAGVTRAGDSGANTGDISNAINEEEGVFFAYMAAHTSEALSIPQWLTLSEGSSSNSYIALRYSNAGNSIQFRYAANGGSAVQVNTTDIDRTNFNKIAFRWKANDFSLWINGSLIQTVTTLDIITANNLNKLTFGTWSNGQRLYGKVKQIRIYDEYESDLDTEELTSWKSFNEMANALNYTIE